MDQATVIQIATVIGPAVVAFLAGHFHVILPAPVPSVPAKPATPAAPLPTPAPVSVVPWIPSSAPLAPVGQGGLLQALTIFLQTIAQHPAGSVPDKNAAASAAINAIQPLLLAQVTSNIPS